MLICLDESKQLAGCRGPEGVVVSTRSVRFRMIVSSGVGVAAYDMCKNKRNGGHG